MKLLRVTIGRTGHFAFNPMNIAYVKWFGEGSPVEIMMMNGKVVTVGRVPEELLKEWEESLEQGKPAADQTELAAQSAAPPNRKRA